MIVNAEAWRTKQGAITRFVQAWRGAADALHADSAAMKSYADSVHLPPELIEKAMRAAFPKPALQTDQVAGLDEIVSDAVKRKTVDSPPGKDRLAEFTSCRRANKMAGLSPGHRQTKCQRDYLRAHSPCDFTLAPAAFAMHWLA
jgi:hypothetical protein